MSMRYQPYNVTALDSVGVELDRQSGGCSMMTPPARTPKQRKQDALNRLEHDTDAGARSRSWPCPANSVHGRLRRAGGHSIAAFGRLTPSPSWRSR